LRAPAAVSGSLALNDYLLLLMCVLMLFLVRRELRTGSSLSFPRGDVKRSEDPLLYWIAVWMKVVLCVGLMLGLLAKVAAPEFYTHYLAHPP
jgi:uncharacterized membrane protein YphA (DoxX/SURF4 family)